MSGKFGIGDPPFRYSDMPFISSILTTKDWLDKYKFSTDDIIAESGSRGGMESPESCGQPYGTRRCMAFDGRSTKIQPHEPDTEATPHHTTTISAKYARTPYHAHPTATNTANAVFLDSSALVRTAVTPVYRVSSVSGWERYRTSQCLSAQPAPIPVSTAN